MPTFFKSFEKWPSTWPSRPLSSHLTFILWPPHKLFDRFLLPFCVGTVMTHEFRRPCHGQESNRQTADGARAFSLSKSRRQFTYARVCSIGGYVLSSANFCLRGCVNPASLLSLPAIVFRNLLEINFHFRVQGLTLKLFGLRCGRKKRTRQICHVDKNYVSRNLRNI